MQGNTLAKAILVVLLLMLVVIVVLGVGILAFIRDSTTQALAPIAQANEQIRTQVSSLLNPTPTIVPDPITIVREVRSLARLETIQYSVEKVITAESGRGRFEFLFGDRLLLVAHGTVIAGIDLAKVSQDDIWWEGELLHVRLPEPEIFVATLNNDDSYVYDRDTGLLTRGQVDLESLARQAAEEEILRAALEDNILEQARQNGENFLASFLRSIGHPDVVFEYDTAPALTPTP